MDPRDGLRDLLVPPLPRAADRAAKEADAVASRIAKAAPRLLYVSSFDGTLATLKEADGTVIDEPIAWAGVLPPQAGDAVVALTIPGRGSRDAAGTRVAFGPVNRTPGAVGFESQPFCQSTADAGSTTSTSTYVTAATFSLFLPPGVWTVDVMGGISLTHSAGGQADYRIDIDGAAGFSRRTRNLSATVYSRYEANQTRTGVAGNRSINVEVKYKGTDAGTTSAANPSANVMARRIA